MRSFILTHQVPNQPNTMAPEAVAALPYEKLTYIYGAMAQQRRKVKSASKQLGLHLCGLLSA